MATVVVMPRQGNTVESCIIAAWKKKTGDPVSAGDVLCEIETDKATMEVESPASGVVLALLFDEGDDVPVLTNIAVIGEPGEKIDDLLPAAGDQPAPPPPERGKSSEIAPLGVGEAADDFGSEPVKAGQNHARLPGSHPPLAPPSREGDEQPPVAETPTDARLKISPRARGLATRKGVEATKLRGSGPGGRIIERDVQAAIEAQPVMTPLSRAMAAQGDYAVPAIGSGIGGRVMAGDLIPAPAQAAPAARPAAGADKVEIVPLKGVRKIIAERMLASTQTTAQLTLNASAGARALKAYRQRLKNSPNKFGLQQVTINDLLLLAVSRTLPQFPELNAHFTGDALHRYQNVNLGMAVDTPRGLMVPVIRRANTLSLKQISQEGKRLASACLAGQITPDELNGGTFTVTNLGALGIESFTPVLNPPEVGILGVGNITLKPVQIGDEVQFIPHIGLSLTINHQVVDGAPAARFLQALSQALAEIELLLAV